MPGDGYPLPPTEPEGGWKNDAQWIGNVENWAREMMRLGFTPDDLARIYPLHVNGDPFPKNLMNSIRANNWLFPGADMMYEYDLDNKMKRHFTYNDPAIPGAQKGPFEWEPMHADEISALNQYYGWRNDPAHDWMIRATIDSSGEEGNPYAAWLRQWGDYYKDENYKVPTTPERSGKFSEARDIFGPRDGFDPKSGKSLATAPVTPTPVTPTDGGTNGPTGDPNGPLNQTAAQRASQLGNNWSRLNSNPGVSSVNTARGFGLINNETEFATPPPGNKNAGWGNMGTPGGRRFKYR